MLNHNFHVNKLQQFPFSLDTYNAVIRCSYITFKYLWVCILKAQDDPLAVLILKRTLGIGTCGFSFQLCHCFCSVTCNNRFGYRLSAAILPQSLQCSSFTDPLLRLCTKLLGNVEAAFVVPAPALPCLPCASFTTCLLKLDVQSGF